MFCAAAALTIAACSVDSSARAVSADSVVVFCDDLLGFMRRVGRLDAEITFDDLPDGADLRDRTIDGVTFVGRNAPLAVVRADATFVPRGFTGVEHPERHRLHATSGAMILSPGGVELAPGPNSLVEDDSLTLRFGPPIAAFGFDHLSQAGDGLSYTSITVFDADGLTIMTTTAPVSSIDDERHDGPSLVEDNFEGKRFFRSAGEPSSCTNFWGIVSKERPIAAILFDEHDSDAVCADSNIGYDSFVIAHALCEHGGDLNCDGLLDGDDIALMLTALGTLDCDADLDGSGAVDGHDLQIWFDRYAANQAHEAVTIEDEQVGRVSTVRSAGTPPA